MNNLIWKKQSPYEGFIKLLKQRGFVDAIRGAGQYIWRQILYSTYPFYEIFFDKKSRFIFNGRKYSYCLKKYNLSFRNERTIEIPIIQKLIRENSKSNILEVGCVLHHYDSSPKVKWTVIDKYESFKDVLNVDIIDFKPKKMFDLIFSVSTIEHIGIEDGAIDKNKAKNAIDCIVNNCLKKNGRFIFTIPIGYNKYLDKKIFNGEIPLSEGHYFIRIPRNKWFEVTKDQIIDSKYNKPYIGANALFIGVINK